MRSKNEKPLSRIEIKRREEIIACAITSISRNGYAAVTLADIARQTGLTKGTLIYYFKTKEMLIEAVIRHIYAAGAAFMLPYIKAEKTVAGQVRAYIVSNIHFMHEHREHIIAFISIITNISSAQHERLELVTQSNKNTLLALANLLKNGQQQDEFGDFAPMDMALAIRGVIDGAALQITLDPMVDMMAYAKNTADMFVTKIIKGET